MAAGFDELAATFPAELTSTSPAGAAGDLACNLLSETSFEAGFVTDNFFNNPDSALDGAERVLAAGGVGGSGVLVVGEPGRYGRYGEWVPIQPGVAYELSAATASVGELFAASLRIEWLDADFQLLETPGGERSLVDAPPDRWAVRSDPAPAAAAYAVPGVFKDGSPGVILADDWSSPRSTPTAGPDQSAAPPTASPGTVRAVVSASLSLVAWGPGVDPVDEGARWEVGDGIVIGRDPSCDVVVDVPNVSRRHAEIVVRAGRHGVRDLDSSNGTMLNGDAVDGEETWLRSGDELVLGGAVALRFEDPLATPIAPRLGRLTGVWIDPDTEAVWVDARRVEPPLSARQLHLLRLLLDADGELVDRRRVVDEVWAEFAADGVSDEAVAALIKRLRARLSETGRSGGLVEVVRGRGLRLVNPTVDD